MSQLTTSRGNAAIPQALGHCAPAPHSVLSGGSHFYTIYQIHQQAFLCWRLPSCPQVSHFITSTRSSLPPGCYQMLHTLASVQIWSPASPYVLQSPHPLPASTPVWITTRVMCLVSYLTSASPSGCSAPSSSVYLNWGTRTVPAGGRLDGFMNGQCQVTELCSRQDAQDHLVCSWGDQLGYCKSPARHIHREAAGPV